MTDIINSAFTSVGRTPLIHLGGDEVDAACWEEDANISAYMSANAISTE